jgi:hypothetical protein
MMSTPQTLPMSDVTRRRISRNNIRNRTNPQKYFVGIFVGQNRQWAAVNYLETKADFFHLDSASGTILFSPRMKMRRPHRVPLSRQAVSVLTSLNKSLVVDRCCFLNVRRRLTQGGA